MPSLSITDSLGNPVDVSTVKWTNASSLYNYLKSEALHLAVVPDYMKLKDKTLTDAAPKPTKFQLSVKNDFQLGGSAPEIDVTPAAQVVLTVNTTAGSALFDDDSFELTVTVPAQTGYVGMSLEGSLDLGVSGTSGDLSFGVDRSKNITLQFMKAFATGQNQPTLWNATAALISDFVIPASVDDLKRMGVSDIACVSGEGSLQVSGAVDIAVPVNPLASVNLPLGLGTVEVNDGVMAGVSVSLTLSGSYQIRVQKLLGGAIRLSYLRAKGSVWQTDAGVSAGVTVIHKTTDLLAKLLGVIAKGKVDAAALSGLTEDEVAIFTSMLQQGIDHSLLASIDLILTESASNQVAFQYEVQPDLLDAAATAAVNRALKGDLSLLTALEGNAPAGGAIAPGVKMLNSVFSTAKTKGVALKVNLLGIVNLISSTQLINKCEFLFDPASGDLTIKETAQSARIDAITDPYLRQQALCKAIFDSVLVTTTYVASKVITLPALSCQAVHFAGNKNTSHQNVADYTNWFVAMNLMQPGERAAILIQPVSTTVSTCAVRAPLDDAACEALFFDGQGNVRDESQYLEIGRQAMKALLDPADSTIDQWRYKFLDNDATWPQAVAAGPTGLRDLMPLPSSDASFDIVLNDAKGDLYDILWWADAMHNAGQALHDMRAFLAGRDPATTADSADFASGREALQKLMLKVVSASKVRFKEPWGLVCLYWAAGSRTSSGNITAGTLVLHRDAPQALTAAGQ